MIAPRNHELPQSEWAPKEIAADVSSTLRSSSVTEDGSAEPSFFCRQDAGSTLRFMESFSFQVCFASARASALKFSGALPITNLP